MGGLRKLTRTHDASHPNPGETRDLAECLNTAEETSNDGSNQDKDPCTPAVGKCVEADGNANHATACDEDPD